MASALPVSCPASLSCLMKGTEMPPDSPSLYACFFTPQERRDLRQVSPDDLTGEINLQRALLVLIQSASPPGPLDFEVQLEKNRASNLVIHSLLVLIRSGSQRRDICPEWAGLLSQAAQDAASRMGVPDYLRPSVCPRQGLEVGRLPVAGSALVENPNNVERNENDSQKNLLEK